MSQDSRPISPTFSFGSWVFVLWFMICVAFYCYKIPLHPLDDIGSLIGQLSAVKFDLLSFLSIELSHFQVILLSIGYLLLFLATGARLLKPFNVHNSVLGAWIWSFGMGLTFWGMLAEALAFSGLLYESLALVLVTTAGFLLLIFDQKRFFTRVWPFKEELHLKWPWKWIIGLFGLLTLSNLLAPEMSWDAITYQLVLPKYYLAHHGFYPVLGITPAQYPSLGQMFFFWGLIWQDDSIARFFSFWVHLATIFALMELGRNWGQRSAGYYAAAFYAFFPYLNIYSTRGYVDLFAGFFAVIGFNSLVRPSYEEKKSHTSGQLALIVGAFSIVWALKYNAVVYSCTAIVLVWVLWKDRRNALLFCGSLLLAAIFCFSPWVLKSWIYVHDPVFPYLTSWFHAWDWTPFDQAASWIKFPVEGWRGLLKAPTVLYGIFFNNYSGAPHEEVGLGILIFLPFLLIPAKKKNFSFSLLLVLVLPLTAWLVTSQQLRLMTPVIFFASFAAGLGFDKACEVWSSRKILFQGAAVILAVLSALYLFQGLLAQPNPYLRLFGLQSRDEFLERVMVPKGYVTINEYLNGFLPENAKVLVLGQQNAYYLQRESVYDFDYNHAVLKDWADHVSSPDALFRKFKENGFDYILYNSKGMVGQVVRLEDLGVDRYAWTPLSLHNYEQFFLRFTQKLPLPVDLGYSLYRVGFRKGFSALPEYLPGTEKYYLDEVAQRMGYRRAGALVGKNIPADIYLKTYDALALHYAELGFPCFQSALADLSTGRIGIQQVLNKGKVGLARNGDEVSWLVLQADVQLERGRFGQAVVLLEKAEDLSPEREDVARNLSVAYYNEHRLDKAVEKALLTVQLNPSSVDDQKLLSQLQSLRSNH